MACADGQRDATPSRQDGYELFLHIGTDKTGSSALQAFFAGNRIPLTGSGIYYPQTGRGEAHQHHSLFAPISPFSARVGVMAQHSWPEYLALLEAEMQAQPCRKILISTELLSQSVDFSRLPELFSLFTKVTVIVYLRRQDQLLMSRYVQFIKTLGVHTDFEHTQMQSADYLQMLEQWEAVCGRGNIIVRPYEKQQFARQNIFSDFMLHVFGVDDIRAYALPDKNDPVSSNPRITQSAVSFMRRMNVFDRSPGATDHIHALIMYSREKEGGAVAPHTENTLLSPAKRLEILRRYEKSNQTVARRYLSRKDGVLFRDPLPDPNQPWEDGLAELPLAEAMEICRSIIRHSPHFFPAEQSVEQNMVDLLARGMLYHKLTGQITLLSQKCETLDNAREVWAGKCAELEQKSDALAKENSELLRQLQARPDLTVIPARMVRGVKAGARHFLGRLHGFLSPALKHADTPTSAAETTHIPAPSDNRTVEQAPQADTSAIILDPAAAQGVAAEAHLLLNSVGGALPQRLLPFSVVEPEPEVAPEILERLTDAYFRAKEHASAPDGLWAAMQQHFHGDFLRAVEDRNHPVLGRLLGNLFREDMAQGIFCGSRNYQNVLNKPYVEMLKLYDIVLSFAQALGVSRCPNPATGENAGIFEVDISSLLDKIAAVLGYDLSCPQLGGMFGIGHRGAVLPQKQFFQLYMAWRVGQLLPGRSISCLEIGGGVGMLAYNMLKMGIASSYCIIDLPLVNLLQGYVLLRSDIAGRVRLYGEEAGCHKDSVMVYPNFALAQMRDARFTIAVNQDSFPEMAHETMEGYLDNISRIVTTGLLSINQESSTPCQGFVHGSVFQAMLARKNFRPCYRAPFWLRKGYVEEFYRLEEGTNKDA